MQSASELRFDFRVQYDSALSNIQEPAVYLHKTQSSQQL